jgi:transposase-like protein
MQKPAIVLTDPKPMPKALSDKCPRCRAGKDAREKTGGFGGPQRDVCAKCGYEFPLED